MPHRSPLIVLIDDDYDCLEVNRQFLETAGFRVVCCFDAAEALKAMDAETPALVITDLMMQSLDSGFSLTRQIKQDPKFADVPVVLMTAVGSQLGYDFRPRCREDLAAMHVDAYIDKPIPPQSLIQKVRELLGSRADA
jgi:CheY-like chemotaxis protein